MITVTIQHGHGPPAGHHGPRREERTDCVLRVTTDGHDPVVIEPAGIRAFQLQPGDLLEVVCQQISQAAPPDLEPAAAAEQDDVPAVDPPAEPAVADAPDQDPIPAAESTTAP